MKQILSLYLCLKEQFEPKMFTGKYIEIEDEIQQRKQKLVLSTSEILDFNFQEKCEFKKSCEHILSLSAKGF